MVDLHCHILPGIDDGAANLGVSLGMAQASVADGVSVVVCMPHILPGLYHNAGPQVASAVQHLQDALGQEGIPLRLVAGADVHMVPDLIAGLRAGLRSGRIPSIAGSRYVLVEPPHHTAPPQLESFFSVCWSRDLFRSSPILNDSTGFSIVLRRFANWSAPGCGCKLRQDRSRELLAEMPNTGLIGCLTKGVSISWRPTPMILIGDLRI
jgi:hypothetical protein